MSRPSPRARLAVLTLLTALVSIGCEELRLEVDHPVVARDVDLADLFLSVRLETDDGEIDVGPRGPSTDPATVRCEGTLDDGTRSGFVARREIRGTATVDDTGWWADDHVLMPAMRFEFEFRCLEVQPAAPPIPYPPVESGIG